MVRSPLLLISSLFAFAGVACASGDSDRDSDVTEGTVSPNPSTPASPGPSPTTPGSSTPGAPTPTVPAPGPTPEPTTPAPAEPAPSNTGFGTPVMTGNGQSAQRYQKADVTRDGKNYFFMANGWGPGFDSQTVSWNGTSFTVVSMEGSQGNNYEPASYPTMFCGAYSDSRSRECGLPAQISSLQSLRTGWKWEPNGNTGEYNAAYDVWLSNSADRLLTRYLMVWLRDPLGQQPAGSIKERDVQVENVPGTWVIWEGMVNGLPIINWARAEGQDSLELEFDVLDFIRDAQQRGYTIPETHIQSVAVGFEIWNGPVSNLTSVDFYVDVQ